jgi:protein-ribulosamine 3-kinase
MCSKNEEPVLIDPAVYYGIPAVDIGMTKLFGGFNKTFYEAYQYHSGITPIDDQSK